MPIPDDIELIDTLTDPDKVLTIPLTCRQLPNGERRFTVAIKREYVKGATGEVRETFWLQRKHLVSLRNMIDDVIDRMDAEEEKARLAHARGKGGGK